MSKLSLEPDVRQEDPGCSRRTEKEVGFPLVSVVIPSYNKGPYLRETIQSVLDQDYPNVEILVYDGGSTDESASVIHEFKDRIQARIEPDRGQSHAINKGFQKAKGDILTWLCADDLYVPGTLRRVARAFQENPDVGLVYGNGDHITEMGELIRSHRVAAHKPRRLRSVNYILQPATFWRREVYEKIGGVNENYHWGMDWDYWIRASKEFSFKYLPHTFAQWRLYPGIKSFDETPVRMWELASISRKHGGRFEPSAVVMMSLAIVGFLARFFGLGAFRSGICRIVKSVFKVFYGKWAAYG